MSGYEVLGEPQSSTKPFESIHHIFIFYNPTSGGNTASVLANSLLQQAKLHFGSRHVYLSLWNISECTNGIKPGFLKLKSLTQKVLPPLHDRLIRVIVGGGDGTVMWCIAELDKHSIDLDRIAIAVIPFGTGNDFARALFWEENKFSLDKDPKLVLRELAYQWLTADIIQHDLWNVNIELLSSGQIRRIDPRTREKTVLKEKSMSGTENSTYSVTYKMCNYFSMGVESRIGVGFDRYRTTSPFWNKLRYAAEGIKKSILKHTLRINQLVSSMSAYDSASDRYRVVFHCPKISHGPTRQTSTLSIPQSSISSLSSLSGEIEESSSSNYVLESPVSDLSRNKSNDMNRLIHDVCTSLSENNLKPSKMSLSSSEHPFLSLSAPVCSPASSSRKSSGQPPLLDSAASLIAINIPSFAAGLDIWKSAHRPGLISMNGQRVPEFTETQKLGDGKLEFLIFRSAASIGFERMAGLQGRGRKVCQEKGPFVMLFHTLHPDCRVYYQIDGEFYVMSCPKKAIIALDKRIRVLASPKSPFKANYVWCDTTNETNLLNSNQEVCY